MSNLAKAIYERSPVLAQHLIVSAYGWQWKRRRFGGVFQAECRGFRERERYTAEQWTAYTTHHLRSLLKTAFTQVPYYRELGQRLGLTLAQIEHFTLAELRSLPPLEKRIARDQPHSLLVGGSPTSRHAVYHTSGSSGTPVATYWLPEEHQRSLALREARSCGFAGVSFTLPRATFSGRIVESDPNSRGPFYRFNMAERQVYFSAFHLRPETCQAYLAALARHRVQWITGYSNSIYQLAKLALDLRLECPTLKAVITTSEALTPDMRGVIERAFSTRTYEEYGTVEDLFYVSECEHGRKHISPDAGILEVVDDQGRPVAPGEEGEVWATGFVRLSHPMIRYRMGDRAVMDDRACPCGREMPVLHTVLGRIEDTIYGPDGRRMVRFHGIFVDQPHVQEGQIVQEHIDLIRVRIVVKPGFGAADEADIIQRMKARLGDAVRVVVEPVPHIERTRVGKFKAVVSLLPPEVREQLEHRARATQGDS
jgi:phenylacetate-CoA ligase